MCVAGLPGRRYTSFIPPRYSGSVPVTLSAMYLLQKFDPSVYLSLALLFGIAAQFRRMGGYDFLTGVLGSLGKKTGPFFAVTITTCILSPFILNDVLILILTPVLAASAVAKKFDATIFVVTEIVFTNISSSLTPFGNPQNILLWEGSRLGAAQFVAIAAPPVAVSAVLALAFLYPFGRKNDMGAGSTVKFSVLPGVYLALEAAIVFVAGYLNIQPVLSLFVSFVVGFAFQGNYSALVKEFDSQGLLILYALITLVTVSSIFIQAALAGYTQPAADLQEPYSALFMLGLSNLISNVPATQLILATSHVVPQKAPLLAVEAGLSGNFDPISSLANLLALNILRRNGVKTTRIMLMLFATGAVSAIPLFFLNAGL